MVVSRSVMIIPVLMALVLAVAGHKNRRLQGEYGMGNPQPCPTDPSLSAYDPACSTTSTSTESTTQSTSQTVLQQALWCRLPNGTYLSSGSSYLNAACSRCQCLPSRIIRCLPLECMPTYCADNSMPSRRAGQCCTQCAYEPAPNTCQYNNFSYPHGTVMKSVDGQMQCWCQLGNIECRNYMNALFQGLSDGTAVYIIVVVLVVVLLFGFLLCCSCTVGCYYYFRRNQHTMQQAYDEYINSAGWQPMDENAENAENVFDQVAEEKRLEDEKAQFENSTAEVVPPPYASYNGSYVPEEK